MRRTVEQTALQRKNGQRHWSHAAHSTCELHAQLNQHISISTQTCTCLQFWRHSATLRAVSTGKNNLSINIQAARGLCVPSKSGLDATKYAGNYKSTLSESYPLLDQ